MLKSLPHTHDPNLLVGFDTSDDACVYRLNDDLVLIQTVDFFTPIVDDPYQFGQIAAANALSDVYAMGASPGVALNILCVPSCMAPEDAAAILSGGADKAREAGAIIAGGHSVIDPEPKYGLCVSAWINPKDIWSNATARSGDVLVLTKPLGNGIMATAAKRDHITQKEYAQAVKSMATLNKNARDAAIKTRVHACTDITGFGFIGHASEMAEASGCTFVFTPKDIPLLDGVYQLSKKGIIPGGTRRNMDYLSKKVSIAADVPKPLVPILYDPQTSGGLLLSVPEADKDVLMSNLVAAGVDAAVVGHVCPKGETPIIVLVENDRT